LHTLALSLFDPDAGQGARQFAELGLALLLSTMIGAERAIRQKRLVAELSEFEELLSVSSIKDETAE